jgi:hypothetical protein
MAEENAFDETKYEFTIGLIKVPMPRPPLWQSSYTMRMPEVLEPGMIVDVWASAFFNLIGYIFKKEEDGSLTGPLAAPSASMNPHLQLAVGAPGTYLLQISQTENSSIVSAKIRIVIRKPKKKEQA